MNIKERIWAQGLGLKGRSESSTCCHRASVSRPLALDGSDMTSLPRSPERAEGPEITLGGAVAD